MAKQPLQRLETSVSVSVPKLGKGRCCKRHLSKRWQSLLNEAVEPTQSGALVASRVCPRKQLTKRECVGERESAHLTRRHLRGLNMTALDRAFKAAVGCPLRRHSDCRWGYGLERA
jgi:hypothetical protein